MYLAPEELMDALLPAVWQTDDGVVHIDFGRNAGVTLVTAQQAHARHRELAPGRKSPVLVLCSAVPKPDAQAKRFLSSPPVDRLTAAAAIVTRNFALRHIGNLYLKSARLPYPCRLFATREAALRWLRMHLSIPETQPPPRQPS